MAENCVYLAKQGSFANIGTKKIVNEFKPIIKQGLSRENLQKMYSILEPYNSEIQEISSCMEQQMEMARSDWKKLAISVSVVPHSVGKYRIVESTNTCYYSENKVFGGVTIRVLCSKMGCY